MPTKRTKRERGPRQQITLEALVAYRRGDRLALHQALRLAPWQPSPIDAEGACPWPARTAAASAWPAAVELRGELDRISRR